MLHLQFPETQIVRGTVKATVQDYCASFVQGWPRYTVKAPGDSRWRTIEASRRPLSYKKVQAYLEGQVVIGSLGKWYPGHALLDFDTCNFDFVDRIRDLLQLDDSHSMLCTSESDDSYHLIFRPTFRNNPPTLRLLNSILQPFAKYYGIEAYPTSKKPCRLPFGPIQQILDPDLWLLKDWRNKLYWFKKLEEYDLGKVPYHQEELHLDIPAPFQNKGQIPVCTAGEFLYQYGLQAPDTRHESQFKVLYFLWRKNVSYSTAVNECFRWIMKKHNGFSKDIANPRQVRKEIERQASWLYSHYTLPDETHNAFKGYLTKADIVDILHYMNGSLPKSRFLFHLVKYCYPRRLRDKITVHRNLFVEWSSERTYGNRLQELAEMGIAQRGGYYIVGKKSKDLLLKWNYRHPENAILVDERAPDTLESTIAGCFDPEEARVLLRAVGMEKGQRSRILKKIFDGRGTPVIFPLWNP